MDVPHLLVFGLGYTGAAIAREAVRLGWRVSATRRSGTPEAWQREPARTRPDGVSVIQFDDATAALRSATHVVSTVGPDGTRDPVLTRYRPGNPGDAPDLQWCGYLSTTGVYGDRGGGWVDEATAPAPSSERAVLRLRIEESWQQEFAGPALDLFRVAGIYGPGRSAFDDLRAGRARRVDKPGHLFGRIHRDDIAGAVLAAAQRHEPGAARVLNLADDEPAPSADVVAEAARLLGVPPPPLVPFTEAEAGMSPMARSFWADNRRVSSAATQMTLGLRWRFPSYREGLRAILEQERAEGLA